MSITSGTRLGTYEIVAALGAGGMGEVYRARDTRLGRSVAIKVLPESVARDAERIARFEREARALAALNHPHIATLHGLDEVDGRHLLVMELVEGETLADRLLRGPLPVEEALLIGRQIAEALEAAHEKGIVHRDLKPANVKLTPDDQVKVLDFGLAKATDPGPESANLTNSPTLSAMATGAGVILGTAAYMSAEQAKGQPADHRSDVFSFGAVLFEMLTGRQAFPGETVPDILASVLARDPDYALLPQDINPRLPIVLKRCLEKHRRQRWQAIGDVRAELEAIAAAPRYVASSPAASTVQRPLWKIALPVALASALVALLAQFAFTSWRGQAPELPVMRFAVRFPATVVFSNPNRQLIAVAPDGSRIVFAADGKFYIKAIHDVRPAVLPGSDAFISVSSPAFSPDGRHLAFWAASDQTLKRMPADGGAAITVCPTLQPYGLTWTDEWLLYATPLGLWRVPATGGTPERLATLGRGELAYGPQFLDPDTLLYTLGKMDSDWANAALVVQSVRTGERRVVLEQANDARYLPTGHLIYARGGVLHALKFDAARAQVLGTPVPVVEGVRRAAIGTTGAAHYHVSASGTLAYVPGPVTSGSTPLQIGFYDHDGAGSLTTLPPGPYAEARISPNGKQLAFATADAEEATLWVHDIGSRSAARRLTFDGRSRHAVWSPDSSRIAYQSEGAGASGLFVMPANGAGVPERLTTAGDGRTHLPHSWSREHELLFDEVEGSAYTLHVYSFKDKSIRPLPVRSSVPTGAMFSPDARWILYTWRGEPSAFAAIFVEPYPPTGARYQISKPTEDGHHAVWHPDGSQIYYTPGPGPRLMRVHVSTSPSFSFTEADLLMRPFLNAPPSFARTYDIGPMGHHFIGLQPQQSPEDATQGGQEFYVVVNWFRELRQRVP